MKKILITFLIIALLACAGCKLPEEPPSITPAPETAIPTINPTEVPETVNYYDDFVTYVSTAFEGENFIASPTSLRAALCLAIAGADEDTLAELLVGAGFNSKEDAIDWYKKLIKIKDIFDNKIIISSIAPALGKEASFDIANSIWNNDSISQGFKQEYIDSVKELFNADVDSAKASELVAKINNWVNERRALNRNNLYAVDNYENFNRFRGDNHINVNVNLEENRGYQIPRDDSESFSNSNSDSP